MYSSDDHIKFFEQSKYFLENTPDSNDVELLKEVIRYHEWKYYVANDPIISDYEYDVLFKKLQSFEKENPELISSDSPTQRVSQDIINSFNTVNHIVPMLSLENSYNSDDLDDFDKQVRKLGKLESDDEVGYSVEPKFDGGSIALLYENDLLVRAATRGDGAAGEEITANIKTLSSVPLRANFSQYGIVTAELRGEAVIPKDKFKALNVIRENLGQQLLANPRNAATGGLRTKNPNETRDRSIEVFVFQFGYAADIDGNEITDSLNSHFNSIQILHSLGFKSSAKETKLCKGIDEVKSYVAEWEIKRDDYRYEIDGMVVKVDNFAIQAMLGFTSHHPRWAVAFKFKAKQATSKLIAVEYQVGKIGSITPVAKIEPVYLAGVTVSSISLHNEEFIRSKDLRLGDSVLVERSGDVIPYIVKSFPEIRKGHEIPIVFPAYCPINDSELKVPLIQIEGEAAWRCVECTCGAQNLQKIIFHVSKEAMDIDGFGKSIVEKFYELGWIKDISDIYNLNYESIAELEGFGIRSATKLRESIDKAKNNPISKLLHSLSIHHLGKRASKLIAGQIDHVLDLKNWGLEDFTNIKDIGPVVAENVTKYFSIPQNVSLLERMESLGVNLTQTAEDKPKQVSMEAPLSGKTILFTGSLAKMGRKEAEELAEKHGAKNISAVSKNLNILVVGESAGSKLTKAQALGTVEILTEDQFLDLINTI
jgi:DNA ligase (NAD+)